MKKWLYIAALALTSAAFAAESPKETAKRLVKEAIAYSREQGTTKAIDAINSEKKFMLGDIYVTVYNMQGICLAHPTKPERVGNDLSHEKDVDGVAFNQERLKIAEKIVKNQIKEEERWQRYKFQNPQTKKIEPKIAYIDVYDGFIFAAGAYLK